MSVSPPRPDEMPKRGAALVARVVARRGHAIAWRAMVADDLLLPDHLRLGDDVRTAALDQLRALVTSAERVLCRAMAVDLPTLSDPDLGFDRLLQSGALRHGDLLDEVIGRARLSRLAAAITPVADGGPSLLARLAGSTDEQVAAAAIEMLVTASRRATRDRRDDGPGSIEIDLRPEQHEQLIWLAAAALAQNSSQQAAVILAAQVVLADRKEGSGDATSPAASRLASALGSAGDAAPLLAESVEAAELALFTALLGRIIAAPLADVHEAVLDPDMAALCLALRAAGLSRGDIARVGSVLLAAEPTRSPERLLELLDMVEEITPEHANVALVRARGEASLHAARAVSRRFPA